MKKIVIGGVCMLVLGSFLYLTFWVLFHDLYHLSGKYRVVVDYDRPIQKGIAAGKFTYIDPVLEAAFTKNEEKKSPSHRGQAVVTIELIREDCSTCTYDSQGVIEELNDMGFRPADIHELLALREQYPKLPVFESYNKLMEVFVSEPLLALGNVYDYGMAPRIWSHRLELGVPGSYNSMVSRSTGIFDVFAVVRK